jgi:hypothetical protein
MITGGPVNKYYTGIGSRSTPKFVMDAMCDVARHLDHKGYILRSGGADGADAAFESGVDKRKDIYLPWKGFNGNESDLYEVGPAAIALAKSVHPAPHRLSDAAARLHGRNCYQILGEDLETPSEFVICWTPNADAVGGTRTAIKLADKHKVPVFNLGNCQTSEACYKMFEIIDLLLI